ncbi:MAG TPA: nitroreductase family deazaflavin-dependent oxidoreductase [Actinomycetes bacterium]|jgi:deazaflavin-dependent oxidoreductase (nitroreductase family)|nr:nitroreductase family deazaflavin-dependent oxidoreductase [Actinomycetes bacterium]
MSSSRPYVKPSGFAKFVNGMVARLGLKPTLAVRGRKSGQWRTVAVNVLEVEGTRYLIAPRGETQWVRNLRASGEGELRRRGRAERFHAVEVPVQERAPLMQAYLERWRSEVRREFEALPDPADHPTFQLQMVQ